MNHFILAEPSRCIGCNTCMAACALAHEAQGLLEVPRLQITRNAQCTVPVTCRHCEDAPCAKVCPVNAITFAEGAVRLNESLCVGCKFCGLACPFGAITPGASGPDAQPAVYTHSAHETELSDIPTNSASTPPFLAWNVGRRTVAVKCDLCYFQSAPACVGSCPTQALVLVDDASLARELQCRRLENLEPGGGCTVKSTTEVPRV